MKYLLLLIYHDTPHYNLLLEQQKKYIHTHTNFDSYFITLKEDIKENVVIENDIIYVKGSESLMNITYKTIMSIDYLVNKLNKEYDFIIRSNVSTFCNLKLLNDSLMKLPKNNVYTGGLLSKLTWIDKKSGIFNKKHFGLNFVSGTGIILSLDIAKQLINDMNKLDMSIVDDVTIALYIKDYHKIAYATQHEYKQSFIGFPKPININIVSIDTILTYNLIRSVGCKNIIQYDLMNKIQETYNTSLKING